MVILVCFRNSVREAIGSALTYSPFTLAWNGYEPVLGIVLKNGSASVYTSHHNRCVYHTCSLILVSSPDPTYERGSGDIRLVPRASLTLITFWRDFSPPITLQKHNLQCNTGSSWLLRHDDTALFWHVN